MQVFLDPHIVHLLAGGEAWSRDASMGFPGGPVIKNLTSGARDMV